MMPSRLSVLPPLPPQVYLRRPVDALPFPLEEPGCSVHRMGRHAMLHGVRALGLGPGDEVLISAYHHGSEVQALLEAGLTCRFYDPTARLEPDPDILDPLCSSRTKALVLTHYIGFPQDSARWRTWCDRRGLLLIEDAAQSWLARVDEAPVGQLGDMAMFCLYKTYGLPDGAALVLRDARVDDARRTDPSLRLDKLARRHGRWLLSRSSTASRLVDRLRRPKPYRVADDFAMGDPDAAPSTMTMPLLRRLVGDDAAARRRANYQYLASRLHAHIPEGFREVPSGASPHSVPLHVDDRTEFVAALNAAGARVFAFWTYAHPSLTGDADFPNATRWRARGVILPAHQELRPTDLERLADAAEHALATRAGP